MLPFTPVRALIRSRMSFAFHVWSAFRWVPLYLKRDLGFHCTGNDLDMSDGLGDYRKPVLALLGNKESDLQAVSAGNSFARHWTNGTDLDVSDANDIIEAEPVPPLVKAPQLERAAAGAFLDIFDVDI
jgi:hypothetical protein